MNTAASPQRGKFISFEGVDGAGKSTQLKLVQRNLEQRGIPFITTREPGGTPLGERLRDILLNTPMHLETEALLMFAARREHIHQTIVPALRGGQWVLSDRFTDATYAYQGGGRGLCQQKIAILEQWVQGDLQPDLTFVFDVPLNVAFERLREGGQALDRFEQERREFFQRVRDAYLTRAACCPGRIRVIDASGPVDSINNQVEEAILTIC